MKKLLIFTLRNDCSGDRKNKVLILYFGQGKNFSNDLP